MKSSFYINNFVLGSMLYILLLTFLLPAFLSLPGVPNLKIYYSAWPLACLFFFRRAFFNSFLLALLLFYFIDFLYQAFGNYDDIVRHGYKVRYIGDLLFWGFLPLTAILYSLEDMSVKNQRRLSFFITALIAITAFTTLVAVLKDPRAVRQLVGNDNVDELTASLRQNVGGYSFQFLLAIVGPLFLYAYFNHGSKLFLLLFVFLLISVFYSQLFSPLLYYILNSVLVFLIARRNLSLSIYTFYMVLFYIFFVLATGFLVSFLEFIAESFPDVQQVSEKSLEIAANLSGEQLDEDSHSYGYQIRYEQSVQEFLGSPFFGGGQSGSHHYWIDFLARYGLFGLIPWGILLISFFKYMRSIFSKKEYIIVLHFSLIFLSIGFTKNIVDPQWLTFFFIVPFLTYVFGEKGIFKSDAFLEKT